MGIFTSKVNKQVKHRVRQNTISAINSLEKKELNFPTEQ